MRWRWREREGLAFVHPYDDEAIIAGQGTVALEMLRAVPDLDTLVVAVGGGGLIAGMAVAAQGAASRASRSSACRPLRFPAMVNAVKGTHACRRAPAPSPKASRSARRAC